MPHIHEKIDYSVEVFIVHGDKVLLRKHDKKKIWMSVGGHVELDEDPNEAAIREVREEVGIEIELVGHAKGAYTPGPMYRELVPPRYLGRNRLSDTHEHIVFVYFARAKTNVISPQYQSDLSEECLWVNEAELESMMLVPDIKFYCLEALRELQ